MCQQVSGSGRNTSLVLTHTQRYGFIPVHGLPIDLHYYLQYFPNSSPKLNLKPKNKTNTVYLLCVSRFPVTDPGH